MTAAPTSFTAKVHPWRIQAAASVVCLALLIAGLLLKSAAPDVALVVLLGSYVAGMWFPLRAAAGELSGGRIDIDFLMIVVALGALWLGHPDEGALLLVLFSASHAMEDYASARTRSAIQELMRDVPTTARRKSPATGDEEEVDVEAIVPGDRLVVRPGERIPVDSRIIEGETLINSAAITGESEPVDAVPGAEAPSGAINESALIEVEALRPASESAYQKIIHLIENAPHRRSPAQILSDRVGRIYTFVIFSVSAVAFLVWWGAMGFDLHTALYRTMALLVAGSPCALVISLPSAVIAGIAAGTRYGILYNGGVGLLAAGSVTTVALDKTGTLTTGRPVVSEISGASANDRGNLAVAAALAAASTHPASRAVEAWCNKNGIAPVDGVTKIREVRGEGMIGSWQDKEVRLGRAHKDDSDNKDSRDKDLTFNRNGKPEDSSSPLGPLSPLRPSSPSPGSTVTLSIGDEENVRFDLREEIRPDAARSVCQLMERGLRLVIFSGDVKGAVERLARSIGIEKAVSSLRPEDKSRLIEEESARGDVVMMVGDGVNDAPALALAHVGVAMGLRGSAAALEQADIVLQKDSLVALVHAVELGRDTRRVVRQNLAISVGLAAILVSFALAGSLPLALGVLGHEGGTVLVVLNSLRLLRGGSKIACAICGRRDTCIHRMGDASAIEA